MVQYHKCSKWIYPSIRHKALTGKVNYIIFAFLLLCSCTENHKRVPEKKYFIKWKILENDAPEQAVWSIDSNNDKSIVNVTSNIVFFKYSIDNEINTYDFPDTSNLFFHFELDTLKFVLQSIKTYAWGGEKIKIFKLLVDVGSFNEDGATTILYSEKYGILVKIIKSPASMPKWYFLANDKYVENLSYSLLKDSTLFPPIPNRPH